MPAKSVHVLARYVGQSTVAMVLALCLAGCEDGQFPDVPENVVPGKMNASDREFAEKLLKVRERKEHQTYEERPIRASPLFPEVKCENVVVPTVDELEVWVSMLKTWHTAPLVSQDFDVPKDRPVMPEQAFLLQMSMTMALLPYCRYDFFGGLYQGFTPEGADKPNLIEAQFMGDEHEPGQKDTEAHMVAYVVSLKDGGFGLILGYKGTSAGGSVACYVPFPGCSILFGQDTNDWYKNWDAAAARLFVGNDQIQVHRGFLEYKRSLDKRMARSPIPQEMKAILESWGVKKHYENFWQLVTSSDWKWCVCVGHSLGGGMASIAAATLSTRTQSDDKGHVYEVVVGAPNAGNKAFADMMSRNHVRPHGGLRIENKGDEVPSKGLQMGRGVPNGILWRSPRDVRQHSWWWHLWVVKQHLHFEIEEKNQNHQKMVFTFPYYEQVPKNDNYYTGYHKPVELYAGVGGLHVRWVLVAAAGLAFNF